MNSSPDIIVGNTHSDTRGTVRFVNDFNMNEIVRMYCITPALNVVRAWQGHYTETKWFFVAKGSFTIKTIPIENLTLVTQYFLDEYKSEVLCIPGGHYNGFEATEKDSVLMVFSDANVESSKADDIRETIEIIPWN
jgi:dTDP-4-dehydrorhamnose 3,5-epimerase-like enzyme